MPAESPGDDARILLTRRSKLMRSHRHQIGFPGGKNEPGESILLTALRETEEEVGIPREFIRPFAYRSPNIGLNGDPVFTILAESTVNQAQLIANTNEVEEILLVPWTELAKSKCREFSFNIFGIWRQSALYKTSYCNIWGLTANIIRDLSLE
ncbi:MAG: CoA pyrophosphatase [Oligoflexales bacterium]|nr:CoA pyrophosphatase [Oligoflexales bacterium]